MVFNVTIYDQCKDSSNNVYTEGGLHRPAPGTTLISGNLVCTGLNVHPRESEKYSRMVLSVNSWSPADSAQPVFISVQERIQTTANQYNTVQIYGWVDSVRMATEKNRHTYTYPDPDDNSGSIEIRWHVDWWLTAGANAKYKAGRLKRGPSSYARPDPSTPRKWIYDSSTNLGETYDWCVLAVTHTSNDITSIRHYFWQPGQTITINGNSRTGPSLTEIYRGDTETILNVDPETIIGCWISPICPYTTSSPTSTFENGSYGVYYTEVLTPKVTSAGIGQKMTDDSVRYEVHDPTGAVVGTMPWGIQFKYVRECVDIGSAGAFLVMNFYQDDNGPVPGTGLLVTAPLISVPITSNAKASYAYSGQRAYDLEMKRIQNEQQLVSGIANAGTSAIGGAIAGGNAGPAGAAAGAGAGLVSAILGSAVTYETNQIYDAQSQAAVDRLMSNQANNTVTTAGGLAWNSNVMFSDWRLIKMTRDSVSLAELSAEQSELGYLTDTQVADCTSIISGKGGLRIEGLEVYGVAPEGAVYISQMFARGVHLD